MSTRASVVVRDNHMKLFMYQHSDGYPSGLGETIKAFLDTGFARNAKEDVEYLAGALISFVNYDNIHKNYSLMDLTPTLSVHGDEEYQYVIDADTLRLDVYHRQSNFIFK